MYLRDKYKISKYFINKAHENVRRKHSIIEEYKVTVPYDVDLKMRYANGVQQETLNVNESKEDVNRSIEHFIRTEKIIGEGMFIRIH